MVFLPVQPQTITWTSVQTQITAGPESLWYQNQLNHKIIGNSENVAISAENLSVSDSGTGRNVN